MRSSFKNTFEQLRQFGWLDSFVAVTIYLFAHFLGLLLALGFPPFGIWPLTWLVGAVVVWLFLQSLSEEATKKNRKRLAWSFFNFHFAVNLYGFYWVSYTLHEFADMPWPVAILVFLMAIALLGIVPWFMGYYWQSFHNFVSTKLIKKQSLWITCASLGLWLCLFEWLDRRAFPWTWAQSVGSDKYLLSSVGILDTLGWSVLFLLFVLVFGAWMQLQKSFTYKFLMKMLGAFVLFFLPMYALGVWQLSRIQKEYSFRQPVALLQGNVGNYQKKLSKLQVAPTVRNVLSIHRDLIEEAAIRFEQIPLQNNRKLEPWVIWPETSFPGFPTQSIDAGEAMNNFVQLTGGLHIVGAYENGPITLAGKEKMVDFNVAALFHVKSGFVDLYRKRVRVPFGEYIPFDEYFPQAYEWMPNVNHFGKGERYNALAHPDPKGPVFIPLVCYEVLFKDFVDDFIEQAHKDYPGRDLVIVNLTNDSWYGPTSEPFLHSLLSRWSAARVKLPLLRPTNTGLSEVIAPWGEELAVGPRDEAWVIFGELPVKKLQWTDSFQ